MFILKLNTVVNNVAIKQVQKADSTNMYILFMTEFNINRHTEAMHVKKFYPCDNCDYKASGKSILRSH